MLEKNLSSLEINNKLIEYLSKKGLEVYVVESLLYWNYNIHDSNFKINLYIENRYDNFTIIRYYSNTHLTNLHKKKTSTKNNFCLSVYKNLLSIKVEFDKIAEETKIKNELKNKYCNELESYYSKKYDKVEIKTTEEDNYIGININCDYKSYYNIMYKNNKYYLKSKSMYFDKQIEII